MMEDKGSQQTDAAEYKKRLTTIDRKIANINTAIEDGGWNADLKARLKALEGERSEIETHLKIKPTMSWDNVELLLPKLTDEFKDLTAKAIPSARLSKARRIVGALVGGEIMLKPTKDKGLVAELKGHYPALLALTSKVTNWDTHLLRRRTMSR
jgi:hypothetical protein